MAVSDTAPKMPPAQRYMRSYWNVKMRRRMYWMTRPATKAMITETRMPMIMARALPELT